MRFQKLHVLVMAGGSGSRFWPKSRVKKPKQLLALWDEKTLIEHTVDRFKNAVQASHIWIITTKQLLDATKKVLALSKSSPPLDEIHWLGEPVGKNTAPCILWGIREIMKQDPQAVIAVMAADHFIGDEKAFFESLELAVNTAIENNSLVTLGIKPDKPEVGYGYIELVSVVENGKTGNVFEVKQFVEKPDLRTAIRYVESGKYLWNAGMFIFKTKTGLEAFRTCQPELFKVFETLDQGNDLDSVYALIAPKDATSIDFGVMEVARVKGIRVQVVPSKCGWNDVGSFSALEELNCSVLGEVITYEAGSNVVQTDHGVVALLGVSDLVVVRDGDVVLVAAKDRAQDVKKLIEKVKQKRPDLL